MRPTLFKLEENRVRRNYRGGAAMDVFKGGTDPQDCDRPEEWVGSLVPARNPGLAPIENEGLSEVSVDGRRQLLSDLIRSRPEFYLGERVFRQNGIDFGFLFKILDSSMRLHMQAHPTAAFAREHLGSQYGKLECYYILAVREGIDPYIWLGFQKPIDREAWRQIILTQDKVALSACFEKVPVRPGEIWLVPGGMPHAIGEGLLLLEIMEPTDLVVRCEFEREGIVVPPEARFMGRDLDFCLNIFDYRHHTVAEITQKQRLNAILEQDDPTCTIETLVDQTHASSFEVRRIRFRASGAGPAKILPDSAPCERCQVGVVTQGELIVRSQREKPVCGQVEKTPDGQTEDPLRGQIEELHLKRGESFFIAAAAHHVEYIPIGETEVCLVLPSVTD